MKSNEGALPAGQKLNHYRILEKIGEGGMGQVYKAEDTKLGRIVALKLLPTESKEESNARRRLLREARAASALNHPNIITIYAIEESEGIDFIVMEYVEGITLKSVIESGTLQISQLAELGAEVADGLSAAHSAGMIHRDIKPSNILVTPQGQAKILDFGLAKILEVSDREVSGEDTMSQLTKTGMIVGTVAYMSPEQTRGETLDARTDIFSLGCVLYQAATGKVPFSGPSILSILHEIATVDPAAPSSISTKVPQGWDLILKRALAKDREQRYSSAAELSKALRGMTFADRYQILRELGRGGMGIVYLARDPMLERDVAIKVMTPDLLSPEAVERFKREARVVAGMDHPAIVGVHDIGDHDGSLFFIMPFVEGTNLRTFLKDGSLSLGEVLDIGIQVAEALEYSHSKGVVHRDIKPENILVHRLEPEGVRVRVTDFGLAMASAHHHLTKTGTLVGTISYLSPEQLTQRDLDGRSDIYSLGIVLYECLSGKTPYAGEIQSVLYRIAHDIPQSPRALGADIPEGVEEVVMRCLEKDPQQRQQKAKEVADALIRQRSKLRDSERIQKLSMVHRASVVAQRPLMSRLIGREKEFAELQRRLNSALQNECQFVVVGGEAGIGKSRLLDELENLAKARKLRVLHSRFVEQDQAFPFQGFCEAIQEYFTLKMSSTSSGPVDFSDLAPDLISLFPVLAEVEEISGGHKLPSGESHKTQDRTYIFDLLARSFVRIGSGKPLVVFLEDLHNADVSLEALQYIVRRLGPTPTLIVGTYRSTEVDKHHAVSRMMKGFHGDRRFYQMQLEPFSIEEHRSFLETLVGSAEMEKGFVEKLYEATEGNPHFTRELVRSLIDSGRIIKNDTGSWDLSGETALSSEVLPPTIQETVEKRIERLPKEWKEVLSIASIPGRTFEFKDLELLSGDSGDLEDIIDGLIGSGFIEEERGSRGDVFTFSSGIVRDVLYAEVPRRKKRKFHQQYAENLEKRNTGRLEQVLPQLLHHYAEGDVPEKVIEFGMLRMKKALESLSAEDTLRAGKIVLEFIHGESDVSPTIEAEARMLISRAHRINAATGDALQELESAIEIYQNAKASDDQILGALLEAAEAAWEGRKVEEARNWVEKGLDLARSTGQKEILAKLLSLAATIASMRGEHEMARQYLEEASRSGPESKEKEEKIPEGGTLIVALPNPIGSLQPVKTAIQEETEIIGSVFDTVLRMDEQGRLVPFLCEKWEFQDHGKSFVFTLRSGVRMHDGEPLSAERMIACIEQSIRTNPDHLPMAFASIRGVAQFLDGSNHHVEGLTALAGEKLKIELEESLPIYPALLTDPKASIVYQKESSLFGTGPFQLIDYTSSSAVLKKNQDYWKSNSVHLDQVDFRCGLGSAEIASGIRSGNFDIGSNLLPDDLERILQDRQFRAGLAETSKKNIYFVLFNEQSSVKPEVRKALMDVVRIDDLVRGTLGRFAQPAYGLLPPGILGHDPGKRPREALLQENAVELLKAAGISTPIRFKAAIHPIFQDRYKSFTEELLKVWSGVGVEIFTETTTMKAYLEAGRKKEGIDLLIGRYNADYDDPDNFTYFLFHTKTGLYNYYTSPELDRMMEEARSENDPLVREKLYRRIENHLLESGYVLPLFHDIDYRVAGARVRGLSLYRSRPYVKYEEIGKGEPAAIAPLKKTAGGIIHVPFATEVYNLDPSLTKSTQQSESSITIFETLLMEIGGAQIIPWLVSQFSAEEGGKSFRCRLREDVRFHDGRRLTARDVRYSLEYILKNPNSTGRTLLAAIRGGKALSLGAATELEGFQILSATEFLIHLDQPLSFFPAVLSCPFAAIFPEGTTKFEGSWREGCVGTGPFRVIRFDRGRRLELEANPDYWQKGFPKSEGLVFSFGVPPQEILAGFRTGRYSVVGDLFPADVATLRHEAEYSSGYRETPRLCTYYIAFNLHKEPLSDEALRHRLIRGIDLDGMVRRNIGRLGIPAYGLIPPGLLGYEPAKRRSSGTQRKSESATGIELVCVTHTLFDNLYANFAKEVLRSFQENGFSFRMHDSKAEQSKYPVIAKSVDFVMTRWIGDYTDPDTFYSGLLHSERGLVGPFCGTPELDQLIDRGRRETHPQLRHEIYQQAEQMITQRAIVFPLFHEQTYRFARPEVEGYDFRFAAQQIVPYEKLSIRR